MAIKDNEGLRWEPIAAIVCGALLWLIGFDEKWFAFGPWVTDFPAGYPPPTQEYISALVLTGLGLGWSFAAIRHALVISKIIGWVGFFYFYLHVVTLGYMVDPDLFIWKFLKHS